MSRQFSSLDPIAADAFEALIENQIIHAGDLFDLDGETFLQRRDGRVTTFDIDRDDEGGAPCR